MNKNHCKLENKPCKTDLGYSETMLKIPKLILLKFWNLATQSLDALDPITTKIYLFTHCVWINCIIFVDSRLAPYLINSISLQNLSLVSDSFCGKTLASRSWGFYFLPQVSHPVKTLLKLTFSDDVLQGTVNTKCN